MQKVNIGDFKKESARDIIQGECREVLSDGTTVFYVVVKPEGIMRDKIAGLCDMIDKSRGF